MSRLSGGGSSGEVSARRTSVKALRYLQLGSSGGEEVAARSGCLCRAGQWHPLRSDVARSFRWARIQRSG